MRLRGEGSVQIDYVLRATREAMLMHALNQLMCQRLVENDPPLLVACLHRVCLGLSCCPYLYFFCSKMTSFSAQELCTSTCAKNEHP